MNKNVDVVERDQPAQPCECLAAREAEVRQKGFPYCSINAFTRCAYGRAGARGFFVESVWLSPEFKCLKRAA